MGNDSILQDVDTFLARTGMAESTLGRKAVNDGKAINRLRAGKRMWPETIQKLRSFIEEHQPLTPERPAAAPSPEAA